MKGTTKKFLIYLVAPLIDTDPQRTHITLPHLFLPEKDNHPLSVKEVKWQTTFEEKLVHSFQAGEKR